VISAVEAQEIAIAIEASYSAAAEFTSTAIADLQAEIFAARYFTLDMRV
jgi:hypothetical protein